MGGGHVTGTIMLGCPCWTLLLLLWPTTGCSQRPLAAVPSFFAQVLVATTAVATAKPYFAGESAGALSTAAAAVRSFRLDVQTAAADAPATHAGITTGETPRLSRPAAPRHGIVEEFIMALVEHGCK